ncbi:aminoacylase-1 [Aplysia californica]|uniref:N-acyl-aliphatic-L-amino acid amidohydrolase n=1 Tax=Aplysia californica TaxID=6500 RepID=A0ABM0JAM2_APLCA|nr:aminoacylase-1 [Aplysia californica]
MADADGPENPAVSRFREYLRINTMQPTPDYDAALAYLKKQADEIGLEFRVLESGVENRPIGLMTWKGTKPELQAILLTSHMDVVPVFPDKWTHEPFSADKDDNGDIYARGSQDMKCVSSWYLEAIRRFKAEGRTFTRTIHLSFTSDEEIGSLPSKGFSESKAFKDLNIRFGLDEGIASPGNTMRVFYGERSIWWMKIKCEGQPGHASMFIENTAAKKLQFIINKFLGFRDEQEKKFKANPNAGIGAVTTVNMTMLEGGVQPNVVPAELSATFDMRIPPTTDFAALKATIQQWCEEAGTQVSVEFLVYGENTEMVKISKDNPWWEAFSSACKAVEIEIQPEIFPAGTDSRFFRKAGVDMIGFSPMNNTPILLHDHDERLNEKVFLRGIDIYCGIIPALANLEV